MRIIYVRISGKGHNSPSESQRSSRTGDKLTVDSWRLFRKQLLMQPSLIIEED